MATQPAGNLSSIFPGGFTPRAEAVPEDPSDAFLRALEADGLQVEWLQVNTTRPVRVPTLDDSGHERTGWYCFWLDPIPHGVYGDWRAAWVKKTWASRAEAELDPQTLAAVRRAREEQAKQAHEARELEQREAASEAERLLAQSMPAPAAHAYLQLKSIPPLSARIGIDGRLVIPLADEHGAIATLQFIAGDGTKRFLPNGRKRGCFHFIGEPGPTILIGEGFATCASLHQATRLPTVAAFDVHNLEPVAHAVRAKYPAARLVLCADNDQWRKDGNIGVTRASEIAAAIPGCLVVAPQFELAHHVTKPKDFNDLARLAGLDHVRTVIETALRATGLDVYPASRWADVTVPERRWLLPDWIPMRQTTALYGDGGIGKTLLAQQLLTAVATNTKFLGLDPLAGAVLGVFCEDDDAELHIRQHKINTALGIDYKQLHRLHLLSRIGQENLLMQFDGRDAGTLTTFWHELAATLARLRPVLLMIDTAADTFGGNEIVRPQVRQFIQGALTRLAIDHDCAVLLCAHPSAAGMQSGSGSGGSTAWNNSVRSRLYLYKDETTERTTIARKKSNYAAAGAEIELVWNDGCFIPHLSAEASNLPTTERAIEQSFIELLTYCEKHQIKASPHRNGGNYAPKMFVYKFSKSRGLKWTQRQYETAMNNMLHGHAPKLFAHNDPKRGTSLSTKPPIENNDLGSVL